ncbi:MAG: chromosome segregation protein SMC, partial [Cytophagales bacterium]|nr:chromosome segregation protein SMC [Cytophagales bacterium]
MELSKLEIKGFKSFGNKVVINFDKGITGIVGPNGCGKSNIVDAIRWVLGEQKITNLRSEKMENVIFNGTKHRKPTHLAEVAVCFNNTKNILPTAYSQVTVTRRYYRSGEGEYQLNSVPCRLKDITDLFLDTGISSDSYAIIELKKVDDLLHDKNNARRGLFEEAAGIAKFKARKKETFRKLEDAGANLTRVEDLLFEIEQNLKSLEKQTKQAQKHHQLKEEYKQVSIALAQKTVSIHNEKLVSVQAQMDEEADKKLALTKTLTEKEAAIAQAKARLTSKEKTLATRQKKFNAYVGEIQQLESERKVKNEQRHYLQNSIQNLEKQVIEERQIIETEGENIQQCQQEAATLKATIDHQEKKLHTFAQTHKALNQQVYQLKTALDEATAAYNKHKDIIYQKNKALEIKRVECNNFKQTLAKLKADSSEKTTHFLQLEEAVNPLQETLQTSTSMLEARKKQQQQWERAINEAHQHIELTKDTLRETHVALEARQNKFALIQSMIDNLEGFPEAIKYLKQHSRNLKEAPLLCDILTCGDAYSTCIENYLDTYLNYYVVTHTHQAYDAIELLHETKKGKANFFILEDFEHYRPAPLQRLDYAIPALEVVKCEEQYKKLLTYVLDRVYILHENIPLPQGKELIFLTNDGKLTKRAYSVSGGSIGLFDNKKMGRKKLLEKLDREISHLRKKQTKAEQALKDAQQQYAKLKADDPQNHIEQLQKEINKMQQTLVAHTTKKEQLGEILRDYASREKAVEAQLVAAEEASNLHQQDVDAHQESWEEKVIALKEIQEAWQQKSEALNQQQALYNEQNIQLHQQKTRLEGLLKEVDFKQSALEKTKNKLLQNQGQVKAQKNDLATLLKALEEEEAEVVAMYKKKEVLAHEITLAERDYYQERGNIEALEKEQQEAQKRRTHTDTLLMALQNKENAIKLELAAIQERLSVTFSLAAETLLAQDTQLVEDQHTLEKRATTIKEKLEKLGPINPVAIEAYREAKERYDFITTQKEDFEKAKKSLIKTIDEIDKVAKENFLAAFEKIKANFIKVFRSLFTEEDDCDLSIVDTNNPLESTIEVIAKPKGKRPLTINQLSGGEKALTAIALLFAIYLLKPAPFCILDEVDAPLDDVNVDKFSKIIKEFSQNAQFIIVTHNKRTMSFVDVIYGITMAEQGISSVVPVDLRKLPPNSEPGTQNSESGTQNSEPGTQNSEPGTQNSEPRTQ